MQKTIKIGDKEYKMKSSALTQFSYKNEMNRSFIKDLSKLTKLDLKNLDNFEILDDISELILGISYVMIKEADKTQVENYESFLSEIDSMYDDINWILEVIELGCSPISRQLQTNQNK